MIFSPQVDLMYLLTCYVGTSLVIFFTLYFTEGKIMFESVHLICVSCWLSIKIRKRGHRAKTDCISNEREGNCIVVQWNTLTHGSVRAKLLLEPDISPRTVGVSFQKWILEWGASVTYSCQLFDLLKLNRGANKSASLLTHFKFI